ncbi:MAG: helix-turn-helix transcriptional regulator [Oscillospiraceae bacterium]
MNDNFKQLCRGVGISSYELERRTGIPSGTLRQYIAGTRKIGTKWAPTIAAEFDVSVPYILDIEEQKEKPAAPKGDRPRDMFDKLFAELTAENQMRVVEEMLKLQEGQE